MFDKIKLLGISVSSINDGLDIAVPVVEEKDNSAFWVFILLAIIVICIILSKYLPGTIEALKEKKRKNAQKKIDDKRNEELERLHKIKEINKRK